MKKFFAGLIIGILLCGIVFANNFNVEIASFPIVINGSEFKTDKPIVTIDGSTYLPLRAIGDALGVNVDWDDANHRVVINTDKLIANQTTYTVLRVVDGDTIKIMYNGKEESVRMIGIDTPESVHPDADKNTTEGKIAAEFTKNMLEGREVALEFDVQERDQYGRLLAYVYLNGIMFNKILLEEGYAKVATYPPNVKYAEEFLELERQAREQGKGLWTLENNTSITTPSTSSTGTYYWTPSGKSYHARSNCSTLARSKTILSGTFDEAMAQGKTDPCNICVK